MNIPTRLTLGLLALLLSPALAFSQTLEADNEAGQETTVLPKVFVRASRIAPTTGTTIIDKEMIEQLPSRNGSINDRIIIVPGVQYSEYAFHSFLGGEIDPPSVSVSGSRFYENNFTIDGISNNSIVDSTVETVNDVNRLPGHPQLQILDPRLVEQITVYNSNIPAEFGNFTGGQIDAKTIEPADYFWGNINYRTTRSGWTSFHIAPKYEGDFYHSTSETYQPEFEKQNGGIILNIPLTGNTALTASYQQLSSDIHLKHLDRDKDQSRSQGNLFFKLGNQPNASTRMFLTALYAPATSNYFLKDFKNSDFEVKDTGYMLSFQIFKDLVAGQFDLTLAYNSESKERNAKKDRFFWNPGTPSIDWGTGKEGGLGRLETEQKDLNLKSDFSFNPQKIGKTEHLVKLGAKITNSRQSYTRPETSYYYYSPILYSATPFVCSADDPACIINQQYLSRRTVFRKTDAEADLNDYATFLQDAIAWGKFEFFPGVRLSLNDRDDNVNIAPRFSAALDVFGDRNTVFFAGKNRYYSASNLTYTLLKSIQIENQVRTTSGNDEASWTSTTPSIFVDSNLKTPYTDEITIGAIQRVLAGELKVQYINKKGRDEFATTRGSAPLSYTLNNNGRTENTSFQASWQRSWTQHFFEINATWQETTTSNLDYGDRIDDSNIYSTIWFKGEELYYDELPRINYNRPVVVNLVYIGKLSNWLTFTNTTKYRGNYRRLKNTGAKQPSLIDPTQNSYVYEVEKNKSSIYFDWKFSLQFPTFADNQAVLTLEIDNVFDRKMPVRYYTDQFEQGRQFWAGVEFNF